MSDDEVPAVGEPPTLRGARPDAPQFGPAARHPERAEAVTAATFGLSVLAFAGFGAAYWQNASNLWLGLSLGLGLSFFGAGLVTWGKYLAPRGPFAEERHLMATTREQKDVVIADFASRGRPLLRRRFLLALMGAAGAVFGIVFAFPILRSLGPLPGLFLYGTKWRKGSYLTTADGRRVHSDDVDVTGYVTVFPEDDIGGAQSQTMLLRAELPGKNIVTQPGRETWAPDGYIAYSKVCTHAGCPVALYEHATQQLLCPCHQSLFDVLTGAIPVFGPAPRPLPQLPLYIDKEGYLRAQRGFNEPIGPGFWERGATEGGTT